MTRDAPLAKLADRIDLPAPGGDASLPSKARSRLREVTEQVRGPDRISGLQRAILFDSADGPAAVLAAAEVAGSLGVDLYRVDLSAVVSKYIGETEKNLRRLFDAAEDAGAILFFDEADALFGKRSEVRDSHDRYANIEVSFLLERIESFEGIIILASNRPDELPERLLRSDIPVVRFRSPDPPP